MLVPAWHMARARLSGLVAVVCAVAGGAAMVTATGVMVETGVAGGVPPQRLSAADVTVSASQYVVQDEEFDVLLPDRVPLPADVAEVVAGIPGVAAVAGDVSFPVTVTTGSGTVASTGHAWEVLALGAAGPGTSPGEDEVVLDDDLAARAGAAAGDTVTLRAGGHETTVMVSEVAALPGTGLYLSSSAATTLAGRDAGPRSGTVDALVVDVAASADVAATADRIRAALPELVVATGATRGDVEHLASGAGRATLIGLAASMGGTVSLIVGFMVAAALSVSVAGQRRELALLRAVGATPRQVRRLIADQCTLVALAGLPVGVAVGYLSAEWFGELLSWAGLLPEGMPLRFGPLPGVAAVLTSLLVVRIAAASAALRASGMSPTEAVAESKVEPRRPAPWRLRAGLAIMALSAATGLTPLLLLPGEAAVVSAVTGVVPGMVGLALAGPSLVRAVTGRLRRRLRPGGPVSVWLAVHNSHGYALRTAGGITVLALALGLTVVQVHGQTTMSEAVSAERAAGIDVDATVTVAGGTGDRTLVDALSDRPGVTAAVPLIHTSVVWPYEQDGKARAEQYPVSAFGADLSALIDLGIVDGDPRRLTGDTVAVDAATAWVEDVSVGDRLDLILADGTPVSPEVVAVYRRGMGFGPIVASADLITAHTGRGYDTVLVAGDVESVRRWAESTPGVSVRAGVSAAGLGDDGLTPDQWVNLVVSAALLGYVLLGVGNSLVAATTRRRGEFAVLRLVGATPAQVRRMIRRETALVCGMAVVAGLALSVPVMSLLGWGLLGHPWPQGPPWLIPATVALVCAVAYPAMLLPTRRALRSSPTVAVAVA
ncbi:ABC transporter permease [Stackebrandtia albiflava]|nr:FtsX-like permease family protein [Stackebrandtia albiflava]